MTAIQLMVTTSMSMKEIAEEIGVHYNTVYNWNRNEDFIEARTKFMQKELGKHAARAMRTMVELLESEQDNVRYSAAKDILDRAGFKATDKLEISETPKITVQWEGE